MEKRREIPHFADFAIFMRFRGPQALRDRQQKSGYRVLRRGRCTTEQPYPEGMSCRTTD
jgi:hypothetical protein